MAPSLTLRSSAVLLAWLASAAATAEVWQADRNSGTLRFVATQAGARFSGHFGDFQVRFDFDPKDPASARLHVTIATQSADTADADRDEVLHGHDFFWVERFPQAVYHVQGLKREEKAWVASGTLTLRGVKQPIAVRFELTPKQGAFTMKGGATLRRLEFGVGQGEWASTTWIGDPVDVAFDLKLRHATAATGP
jgi:polyisoprenoid-binding protein YceI